MTFATLATIHRLLEEEKQRTSNALELLRKTKNEAENRLDLLLDAPEEEYNEAKAKFDCVNERCKSVSDTWSAARNALEDFNSQDFR